jgi:methionyl-tRNA formyltransferase
MPISVLYAGSPDFSALVLRTLAAARGESFRVAGALTNPPVGRGRGMRSGPTPVALCAAGLGIPVLAPEKLDARARESVSALGCDMLVCFSYGKIFGPKFLDLFAAGAINVHPSLLPKYRGATPVPHAILNRENVTGVTVQKIALKMDSGNIIAQKEIPLNGDERADGLLSRLADEAASLLPGILDAAYTEGALPEGIPQNDSEASYCARLQKEDGRIDWNRSALDIDAKIRAFFPWPGTFAFHGGDRINVHKARPVFPPKLPPEFDSIQPGTVFGAEDGILVKTGDGILALQVIQRPTKKALGWRDFLNGSKSFLGARLTGAPAEELEENRT